MMPMPIVNFDLSFQQHASPAIRQDAIADGRPLAGAGVSQLSLQLGNISSFNEPELVSLG